jgi:Rad3-related DNA helicase
VEENGTDAESAKTFQRVPKKIRTDAASAFPRDYRFAREHLWSKADRVLAMSATILNPRTWARNLGVPWDELATVEVPCPFPIENRPIILDYAGDMSWKNLEETLPKLYLKVAQILERHRGQRGIIHAHSERLVRQIVENVGSPRFVHLDMFPQRNKTLLLDAHAERPDSVIVASAMHEGLDLRDDLARFQIIAKIPWPSTEDALVKARMELDGGYLPYQTALKLVQSYGRIVRHEKDYGTTYVIDAGFEGFRRRCGYLLPKWFLEAIR